MASDAWDVWEPLGPGDVDVERDEDRLLDAVRDIGPRAVAGRVRVATDHPFFFEHACDHLPGLYLLESGRQLAHVAARRALLLPAGRVTSPRRFAVRFDALAETDAPIVATAGLAAGPTSDALEVSFTATQAGRMVVHASSLWTLGETDGEPTDDGIVDGGVVGGRAAPLPRERRPVSREAVHKRLDENVLLEWTAGPGPGACEVADDDAAGGVVFEAGLRRLADHAYFAPGHSGRLGGLYLVEACRQLAEAVAHGHLGVPLGHVFLIEAMDVSLPATATLDAPVRLEVAPLELERRGRALRRMKLRYTARQAGRVVLEAVAGGRVLPPSLYRRLRGQPARGAA